MNETISTIYKRRSVRRYTPQQLKKDELDAVIDCGLNAPSGMNTQNWHFTVIQSADMLKRMNSQAKETLSATSTQRMLERYNGDPNFSVFYGAPTVIIVSGESDNKWALANCSFATENMCLAAESLGISSCIVGMVSEWLTDPREDNCVKELGIPEGYKPFYTLCLGYKAMDMPTPARIPGKVNFIV